ncbi:putative secreted protein [Desulfosporosinus orientis DSM 765]|uniref:Putative secreted protein n=1 Tax=Desulfosporosinus orientis (strain ATCC 19365 / DSM 765 / NCIMB 8382 / VKM B-1628 / Singapore I) TaxID=768706 RepID=G7W7L2_DESOD|nr:CD3072 family TudS-related putative desulfidase [Desulfosporosinus orientis]AET65931.1 putative secreted protein [Desulfosporosinus orientis DSM 765]
MPDRIVLLAHCFLNSQAKIKGSPDIADLSEKILNILIKYKCGIIQLPCPELLHGGLARWGQTKYQYDSVFFRRHCEKIAEVIVNQAEEYQRHHIPLGPIIGVEGSPSCGVTLTCDGLWGGELSESHSLFTKIKEVDIINKQGVFMEVLQSSLSRRSIYLDQIGILESEPADSLGQLMNYLSRNELLGGKMDE